MENENFGREHARTAYERPRSLTGVGRVVAIREYVSQAKEEISLKKDTVIFLKEMDSAGWGYGIIEDIEAKEGWFPIACVEPLDKKATEAFRKVNVGVDLHSILDSKKEVSGRLETAIPNRPTREEVYRRNIILSNDLARDPQQQVLKRTESLRSKKESLTNFLRNKISKFHVEKKDRVEGPLVLSKTKLTFNDKVSDVGDVLFEEFEIRSFDGSKVKFKFEYNDYNQPYILKFDPPSGTVSKNKSVQVNVSVSIKVLNTKEIKVNVVSDKTVLSTIVVSVKCIKGVFGVNPLELEMREDNGLLIPTLLVKLKESLVKYNGFAKEGIFRLAASTETCAELRRKLDKDMRLFEDHPDVYTVATLIKIWFRELPVPIFGTLDKKDMHSEDPEEVLKTLEKIPEPQRSLLEWLINMIEEMLVFKEENKMTIENLAICIAPNLYKVAADVDPLEGLILTQKSAKFFEIVIKMRIEEKKKANLYQSKNLTGKPPIPKRPPNLVPMSKEDLAALRTRAGSMDKISKKSPSGKLRMDAFTTIRQSRTPPPRPPRAMLTDLQE